MIPRFSNCSVHSGVDSSTRHVRTSHLQHSVEGVDTHRFSVLSIIIVIIIIRDHLCLLRPLCSMFIG